jgi:NADPH:quinone reductase-like Zn-dependent oxidoreductase
MHAGTCAWIALVDTAELRRGQKLLVHAGAGAIGGMAVQLGKHLGAYVATTCSSRNSAYATTLGADLVIEYDREDFAQKCADYDVVLDLVGGEVHERSYRVLSNGGTLVWLIARPFRDLSAKFGVRTLQAHIIDAPEVNSAVVRLAGEGALKPQISRVMPLAEAAEAHRLLEANRNSRGRIVLEMNGL